MASPLSLAIIKALGGGSAAALGAQSQDAEAGVITRGGKRLIEAWHGSPHQVDKFRMDKIGTGEGAQAYGHGLYFADSKDVAKGYRSELSSAIDTHSYRIDGQEYAKGTPEFKAIAELENNGPEGAAELAGIYSADLQAGEKYLDSYGGADYVDRYAAAVDKFKNSAAEPIQGSLSRVELDVDPDTLLDWDKPLSEQSESVKAALQSRMDGPDNYLTDAGSISSPTGKQIYEGFGFDTDVFSGKNAEVASKELHQFGIPGIRYLDGSSRTAGEGSSNYVMFDDKNISITERGNATPGMLAATTGATGAGMAVAPEVQAIIQALSNPKISQDESGRLNQRMEASRYGEMLAPENPKLVAIANALRKVDTPIGNPVGGVADLFDHLGYNGWTDNNENSALNRNQGRIGETAKRIGLAGLDIL